LVSNVFLIPSLLCGLEALEKLVGEELTVGADRPSDSPNPSNYRVRVLANVVFNK